MASTAAVVKSTKNKLRIGPLFAGGHTTRLAAGGEIVECEAKVISVRGARCCGSGLGGCGLVVRAAGFLSVGCRARVDGGRWGRLARHCLGLGRRCGTR